MKQLILSVRPEHLVNILNGDKTLELRKSVPKNFVGWVYLYATKGKPYLVDIRIYDRKKDFHCSFNKLFKKDTITLNGKVVARFWFDEYTKYVFDEYLGGYLDENKEIMLHEDKKELDKLCLTYKEVENYGKYKGATYVYRENLYAWKIKQLEIFNTPKKLSDFGLTKAPQSWQYVYVKEK